MLHPILETSETVYWDRLGLKSLNFKKSHETAQIKNKKFSNFALYFYHVLLCHLGFSRIFLTAGC